MSVPIRAGFTLKLSCPTTGGKYLTHLSVVSVQEAPLEKQIQIIQNVGKLANQTQNSSEFLSNIKEFCKGHGLVLAES